MKMFLSTTLLASLALATNAARVEVYPQSFDAGGWALDAQFMDTVGSPYLLAHGLGVRVYDDMLTIERREFSEGGSLGADWVMPFEREEGKGKRKEERIKKPHPFSKGELKKVIGKPQFRTGAKLTVEISNAETQRRREGENENSASPRLCVKIPHADGNPDSRVYAYEVVVVGDKGTPKLHKAVYAAGCNMGIGREPNGGVTMLDIPKSELPPGKTLTFAVRPLTSLGTFGKPIATTIKA